MSETESVYSVFKVGDRVQVVKADDPAVIGRTGLVQSYSNGMVWVVSDKTSRVRRFRAAQLIHDVGAQPLQTIGAQPLQAEPLPSNGLENVGAAPLQDGECPEEPIGAQPLQTESDLGEPVGAEALQVLMAIADSLRSTGVLSKCWIELVGRGYYRLVWHRSTGKQPEYVNAKQLANYRDRIERGRVLLALEQVIRYVGRNDDA
jgi:hypothetical protein